MQCFQSTTKTTSTRECQTRISHVSPQIWRACGEIIAGARRVDLRARLFCVRGTHRRQLSDRFALCGVSVRLTDVHARAPGPQTCPETPQIWRTRVLVPNRISRVQTPLHFFLIIRFSNLKEKNVIRCTERPSTCQAGHCNAVRRNRLNWLSPTASSVQAAACSLARSAQG